MQSKEKKWVEIEKIIEEYAEEDEELREKLFSLRVNVFTNKKISNVVEENEKLKLKLDNAHVEISRLRKQLLIGIGLKGTEAGSARVLPDKEEDNELEDVEENSDEAEDGKTSN